MLGYAEEFKEKRKKRKKKRARLCSNIKKPRRSEDSLETFGESHERARMPLGYSEEVKIEQNSVKIVFFLNGRN